MSGIRAAACGAALKSLGSADVLADRRVQECIDRGAALELGCVGLDRPPFDVEPRLDVESDVVLVGQGHQPEFMCIRRGIDGG